MTILRAACAACLTLLSACGGAAPLAPSAAQAGPQTAPASNATGCARTSVGLTPLDDLGSRTYQGEPGGLYPGGSRIMPGSHLTAGLAIARAIRPLDAEGRPSPSGRYVLTSIGMSNTTQEFSAFRQLADADAGVNPRLAVVDGAQGSVTASQWANPGCACWTTLDQRLRNAGASPQQVVAAWMKLADSGPSDGWPSYARRLQQETVTILQLAKARYPNLQLVYLSSRIYAGYATTTLNPEPYAYESGFAVKWTIEDQIGGSPELQFEPAGAARTPWIAWGPYLWADGTTPRSDGLTWTCGELSDDGTHPSPAGREKVARALLAFFSTEATTRDWFHR